MVQTPSPFVYWAQDANNIYLKVDLKDIEVRLIKLCVWLNFVTFNTNSS